LAAVALTVACLKPTFGIPVLALLYCRGDGRAAVAGAALAASVSAIVALPLVYDAGGLGPFLASLQGNFTSWGHNQFTSVADSAHRVDAYLLAGRMRGATFSSLEDAVLTAVLFGLAGLTVRRLPRDDAAAESLSAAVICLATLTGAYHQSYDALLLAAPAVLAAEGCWRPDADRGRPHWAILALLAVPALNFFSSDGFIERFGVSGRVWVFVTTVNATAVLACFLTLVVIGLRWLPAPAPVSRPVRYRIV